VDGERGPARLAHPGDARRAGATLPRAAAYASRLVDTRPSAGSRPFFAPNPPRGAPISYWLRDAQAGPVRLTVTDARGDTVRTIQGPGYAGLQRAQWDGMRDKPRPRAMGEPTTPFELRTAGAGAYTVTMTVGGVTMRQPVVLREWPADRRGRFR
jgi:hypothetical protein